MKGDATITAEQSNGAGSDADDVARAMLSEGQAVTVVAAKTGLSKQRVLELARAADSPDVALLAKHVQTRLRELGMSTLQASKVGLVSRSTLTQLGKDDRVPNRTTLERLDELCSWEIGSSRAVMYGGNPVARERQVGTSKPVYDPNAEEDYDNLARWIEERLRELNMSKAKFAAIGGPGRSTLANMGKSGYKPSSETLERIDTHLMWEPGSALAALKGGIPIRRGPDPTPHPALIPLTAIKDRLRVLSARTMRQQQALEQTQRDIEEAVRHVNLAIEDLGGPRRGDAVRTPGTGISRNGVDAADHEYDLDEDNDS
ncbi:hypothetical protein KL864_33770 [Mycolicibacterium goodii]|uniref:hypothetical protein n=1 Tax=Mycolicibacterium goodii TaxID=134601 RepID=UPI001BDD910A|nr:hypothetical protein [Mycolicibacterium goodii]MBU8820835.1 hypothetical protein [Mycolicibacterium goodii]